ncbi:hypothetical protein KCU99_g5296, partial [Aureobasidium melanogenum]
MQEDISQPLTAKSLSETKGPERPQHGARENSALGNNLDTQSFHLRRRSLPSIIIITLALYSTTFSGVFLLVSLRRQRYPFIRRGGLMSESQAALLTAFLAKTIEIFSTTVFITFLGQVISRKAFTRSRAHGTSLVDMDLRSLVMQPGRLVTHLGSFRYSIRSTLGALTLLAMLSAMLYSTASLPVTATITTILPIYTDTPCGSQPPGSIYERSDSDQFQLYCNGYDIDFNGQGSVLRLIDVLSTGFSGAVNQNGQLINHGRVHHIYIYPVFDNNFPELWSEASSHFTLVFVLTDDPRKVTLVFEGVNNRNSHLSARPRIDPSVSRSSAPHISCPERWEGFDTWLSNPMTPRKQNWHAMLKNQWKSGFGIDTRDVKGDPVVDAFKQGALAFSNVLHDLFINASEHFVATPADDIDLTPPSSPVGLIGEIAPADRDLNSIPDISSLFGNQVVEFMRIVERPNPPPDDQPSASQPENPSSDSDHDEN